MVIRINAVVPVCCQLQCLRRSSRTPWGHRPLGTGPCWTQWADRSSRRLRLRLWPAFSWSLPWLQTEHIKDQEEIRFTSCRHFFYVSKEDHCSTRFSRHLQLCWQNAQNVSHNKRERTFFVLFWGLFVFSNKDFRQPPINWHRCGLRNAKYTRLQLWFWIWGQTRNLFSITLHFRFSVCDPSRRQASACLHYLNVLFSLVSQRLNSSEKQNIKMTGLHFI